MLEDTSRWGESLGAVILRTSKQEPQKQRGAKFVIVLGCITTKTTVCHFFVDLHRPSFSAICFRNAAPITRTSKWCPYLLIVTSLWKIRKVSSQCINIICQSRSYNFSPFWINSCLSQMSNSTLPFFSKGNNSANSFSPLHASCSFINLHFIHQWLMKRMGSLENLLGCTRTSLSCLPCFLPQFKALWCWLISKNKATLPGMTEQLRRDYFVLLMP